MHDLTERYLTLDDGLSSAEKAAFRSEKIDEYNEKFMNPSIASMHGYVDEIIKPEATRERVYADILMLADKRSIDVIHKNPGSCSLAVHRDFFSFYSTVGVGVLGASVTSPS